MAAAAITFAACKKDDPGGNPPANVARVMYLHTVLNTDTLKVKVNDTILDNVPGLTYGTKTNYVSVRPGSAVKTSFIYSNTQLELTNITTKLQENNFYTYFLSGKPNSTDLIVVHDDLTPPTGNNAKVRFVNMVPEEELNIDGYVGNDKVVSNISNRIIGNFTEVPAGTYKITMSDPNQAQLGLMMEGQVLGKGKIYTYVVYGLTNGTGTASLKMMMIQNN